MKERKYIQGEVHANNSISFNQQIEERIHFDFVLH